ncbi:hypothetical protein OEZ86_010001 [Tetradesmus obliquus]|uniref:Glycosyltransferase 2-like domain-containing protein n=1 Tax=Tetradesmus obliquus TaxID=3088 RepID=A0ABY8UP30_TETOB|nr:hypothetical protein OEZ85_001435 [Tetradesmus obliquus]WIA43550.1 hypothetical protein OEZ86_010001 [Tetradesmus obliquus]
MAAAAVEKYQCDLVVLLGDDTEVNPPGWPSLVTAAFTAQPQLLLLLLNDTADPGYPSFPVLRAGEHLRLFSRLLPDCFVNQARLDLGLLQGIAEAVLSLCSSKCPAPAGCDLSLILVVDRAAADISCEQRNWLQQLQCRWLHKVRVRLNGTNAGASATRNRALQESLADYVIMWDDDIRPEPGCLAAYVTAMQQHPQALGFAGPSFVPKCPNSMWACALHMSDCLFFWDVAADWKVAEEIPWAVTANVALVNSAEEFDLRFPKTGGGEDIDYCLRVTGGRLLPVPQVFEGAD